MKMLLPLIQCFIIAACSTTHIKTNSTLQSIPSCISDKIEAFKKAPKQNPPRSVTEYIYNGKTVYYITAPCCDQFSEVLDSNCNLLGHPDGGFTGKGDGKLPSFASAATGEKVIWKDDR